MSKLISYSSDYYEAFKTYYKKNWPERNIGYYDYMFGIGLDAANDVHENILAVDDENNIIGCQLYLPTRALINGVDTRILWSHDTLIDEAFRGDLGMEFMLVHKDTHVFGAGLSLINYKIQKRIKTPFLGTEQSYILLNSMSPFSLASCLFKRGKRKELKEIDTVTANGHEFKRVTDIKELTIPHGGYWFGVESDVEFIRDAHFIEKRFLHNFNKYDLYAHTGKDGNTDMYFVVRLTYRKGFPVLSIIDFRYNKNKESDLKIILKAASKLARINNIPFTLLCTTMFVDKSLYTFKLKENKCAAVLGPKKLKFKNPSSIVFTMADADADFQTVDP